MAQLNKKRKLNSQRVRAINEYIDTLHDEVTNLYEALIDNDMTCAVTVQKLIGSKLRSLKLDE